MHEALDFSLRSKSADDVHTLSMKVGLVLGCTFTLKRRASGVSAVLEAMIFGLRLELGAWPPWPEDGLWTYQLHGGLHRHPLIDEKIRQINLDGYVQELLAEGGAGEWHAPTREEMDREIEIEESIDDSDA